MRAGGGAVTARGELARLLAATGAGLLTSNSGRGAVPEDHEQVIGNYVTTPAGRALLTIGSHFRSNENADSTLKLLRRTSRSTSTRPRPAACTQPRTPPRR
ncbi:hypothetical protein [Streptomyces sp. NBC_01618]|uniref:hypothetical protein n=1 Tax=Streptomyces sp. NBC_01618 TaxID=2975900 RepID=UPI00386440E9